MSAVAQAGVPVGGPGLPQERRLITSIPGPRSQELLARKAAAVAAPMPLEPPTSHTTRPDQSVTGVFRGLNQGKVCMRCSIFLIAAYAISASVNARFLLNFRHCA